MCDFMTFEEALAESTHGACHVLIGNGFSRAQSDDDRFAYLSWKCQSRSY